MNNLPTSNASVPSQQPTSSWESATAYIKERTGRIFLYYEIGDRGEYTLQSLSILHNTRHSMILKYMK